jgi:Zn-finger protein
MSNRKTWDVFAATWSGQTPGLLNTDDGITLYHGFARSYMRQPADMQILQEYGRVGKDDYEGQDKLILRFHRQFYKPESRLAQQAGWLAPDGKFYPCHAWEHGDKAFNLFCACYNRLPDNAEKELEDAGWAKIYSTGLCANLNPGSVTQAQLDTLWEIASLDLTTAYANDIRQEIRYLADTE